MRTSARDAIDRILAAAHIEDEGQLPGQARRTLRWLSDWDKPTIDGICELVDTARRIGELEGLADGDAEIAELRRRAQAAEADR